MVSLFFLVFIVLFYSEILPLSGHRARWVHFPASLLMVRCSQWIEAPRVMELVPAGRGRATGWAHPSGEWKVEIQPINQRSSGMCRQSETAWTPGEGGTGRQLEGKDLCRTSESGSSGQKPGLSHLPAPSAARLPQPRLPPL